MGPRSPRRPLRRTPPVAPRSPQAWRAALAAACLLLGACDGPSGPAQADGNARTDGSGRAADAHFEAGAGTTGTPLPDDIARGLSTDARVLDCPQGIADGRSAFQSDWVSAHPVDLDGDGRDDWLVEGRHACLTGPSGSAWWVYSGEAAGPRLVGALGEAGAIEIIGSAPGRPSDLRLREADGGDILLRNDGAGYAPVAGPAR